MNFLGFFIKETKKKKKKFNGKSKIDNGNIIKNNELKWNKT